MTLSLRLFMPDKKGVGRRVKDAVTANGGRVLTLIVTREMRGANEADLRLSVESDDALPPILEALERMSVTLLGTTLERRA